MPLQTHSRTHESDAKRKEAERTASFSIDLELQEARDAINWRRRNAAEKSLAAWVSTYGIGVFVNDPPPKPHGVDILSQMEEATTAGRPYQVLVARGGGKTSYTEADAAYLIATGKRKFCVIISINAKQAQQIKREIDALFTSEPFVTDYPDIALPIKLLDGHGRRSQRYGGRDTKVRIVTDETLLPTIIDDGVPSIASGACIRAKALKSVRGTKNGTQRPDLVILDDLQTREIAEDSERVNDVLSLIRGDVMGLAGKGKASIISTATTIAADDVTEMLAADPAWKTTRNPAIITWPKEWVKENHGLWGDYFQMYKEENANDLKHTRKGGSLAFYRENRKDMDSGADILNWDNYDRKSGQISGLQKLMDKYIEMGEVAFMAEYQMEPVRSSFAVEITPRLIMSRVRRGTSPGSLIQNSVFTCAATDINPSYALTTAWMSFDVDRTVLIGGYHKTPIKIDDSTNDTAFHRKIYDALSRLADNLKTAGIRFDAWGIDAGGKQFNPVTMFAANAMQQLGINAVAMTGRAGKNWNPNVKSKVRAAINDTVLCRDPRTGYRWLAFNADTYRESMQKAWTAEVGAPGGLTLFDGGVSHVDFADQIANEKLVSKRPLQGGTGFVYEWKSKDPHDYGDSVSMCYALAGADGLNGNGCRVSTSRKIAVCL